MAGVVDVSTINIVVVTIIITITLLLAPRKLSGVATGNNEVIELFLASSKRCLAVSSFRRFFHSSNGVLEIYRSFAGPKTSQKHSTYIAPQAAYCSGAVCHRQSRRTAYRPQPKPALAEFGLQPYSHA